MVESKAGEQSQTRRKELESEAGELNAKKRDGTALTLCVRKTVIACA